MVKLMMMMTWKINGEDTDVDDAGYYDDDKNW